MNLFQRGSVWWLDFKDGAGKRRRVSTRETDKLAATTRVGGIVWRATHAAQGGLTLGALLTRTFDTHWAAMKAAEPMRHIVALLVRELGSQPIEAVTYSFMRATCDQWLAAGKAPATVNRRVAAIGVALREAVRRGELAARPELPHFAENNVRERYLTEAEEAQVLNWLRERAQAGEQEGSNEWRYMLDLAVFLLDTGFRYSETLAFELVDGCADLSHGSTKTGAGRRVPLTPRAAEAAARLVASPVHGRMKELPVRAAWDFVSHRWERAVAACGLSDVTLHTLRHTCASRLVQRGVGLYTVSQWLGHRSIKVTERYAKLAPDALAGAMAALHRPGSADVVH